MGSESASPRRTARGAAVRKEWRPIFASPILDLALGLLAGSLCVVLAWFIAGARRVAAPRKAEGGADVLASAPFLALHVGRGGSARWLAGAAAGLATSGTRAPITLLLAEAVAPDHLDALAARLADEQKSGGRFSLTVDGLDGRAWDVSGQPAPEGRGAYLLWLHDVSAHQRALTAARAGAAASRAALDALSRLIEAAPFPVWHRGPDLRLAMVNSAYVAAVEAPDAAAVVADGIELIDENEGWNPLRDAAAVLEEGRAVSRTLPATIAGERRMMRVVEVPLGDSGVAGYAIDVEEREQARADLARFLRAQHDMLDRLSAGVAQFGRDRALRFFNQPFARLFALAADFLADNPEFNRVLDAMREAGELPEVRDYPAWKAERGDWFTAGLAADEEDWLLPGGKHLRVVAQPLPDGGLLLIFEDRTEQIKLASARDTLLRVRTATFDNLFEAVAVFASDGRLQLWNSRFSDLWQFDEEELAAHPRIDGLTPKLATKLRNPNHAGLVRELVRSATVERQQRSGRVALVDGREFNFAAVPLPDGNALFTMLDVTDSRTVEAALRERNEALEDADRMKTAFVSNMSYELRTPLTSIGGFAEMLAGGYAGALPDPARDYVSAILESVARLSSLIDNVLDLTQSDSGSLLLAEEAVDLAILCEGAADDMREEAAAKEIDFAVSIGDDLGVVAGDKARLRQALDNVLRNAIAYTQTGGRVLLHAEGDADEARIVVSDNGRGIAPAEQGRVFDRFHRTPESQGGDRSALGLGLPLARQFVEAHGGRILLQSEPGAGTTVTIHLPRGGGA